MGLFLRVFDAPKTQKKALWDMGVVSPIPDNKKKLLLIEAASQTSYLIQLTDSCKHRSYRTYMSSCRS